MPPIAVETPAAPHWDFPRAVSGVALLVDHAAEHGVTAEQVLRGTGLAPADLHDTDAVVPATAELTALRNLVAVLPDPAPGLALGRRHHVTSFGVLGFALLSSRSVLDAANLALRFLDLSHIFSTPRPRVVGDELRVALDAVDLPSDLARVLVDRDVTAIHTVLTELVPGVAPFAGVDVGFPAPDEPRRYAEAWGVLPEFDRPVTELRLHATYLGRGLPQANPHAQAVAESLCRDVVARRRVRSGVTEDVRRWITRHVSTGAPMTRAAADLGMGERTLRRRLAEAGTTYQALLDEVRDALAEEMLVTGLLGVEDVAQRLGYAEASSFVHAFRRWRGTTPSRFLSAQRPGRSRGRP